MSLVMPLSSESESYPVLGVRVLGAAAGAGVDLGRNARRRRTNAPAFATPEMKSVMPKDVVGPCTSGVVVLSREDRAFAVLLLCGADEGGEEREERGKE